MFICASTNFLGLLVTPYPFSGAPVYPMGLVPNSSAYGENGGMLMGNRMRNMADGPRRVLPFPGASVAFEPAANHRGNLSLPVVSNPTERQTVPANTQVMLIRSGDGIFLRLSNGLLLNAQNSVFDSCKFLKIFASCKEISFGLSTSFLFPTEPFILFFLCKIDKIGGSTQQISAKSSPKPCPG
ncbi:unnamed protein product [Cylicostephanus goldi]|uniref:Uncharacterized protein n=1 Tax=Cylicostephanus goldi TaxID=71465 RepID=A0A3P7NAY0_CYLGO|nr:unnamed protein product [Cylicostephanus goldi]